MVAAAIYFSLVAFKEFPPNDTWSTYASEDLGVIFQYPDTYTVEERDLGSGQRERRSIVLTAKENLPPPQNGEGPPTITIEGFQNNLDNYSADTLIQSTNFTNFKLSPDSAITPTSIAGEQALEFRWSGLYEGKSIVVARPDWAYVFSVTFLTPEDAIIGDFEKILT